MELFRYEDITDAGFLLKYSILKFHSSWILGSLRVNLSPCVISIMPTPF